MRQAQDGPLDGGPHPGLHIADPQMVSPDLALNRYAPENLLNGGPHRVSTRPAIRLSRAFMQRGPIWAFIRQAPARPSDGGPRPGLHMAGSGKAFIELRLRQVLRRRAPAGHLSSGRPTPTLKRFAYTGPSDSGPLVGPAIRRTPSGPSISEPRPGFHTAGPTGRSYDRPWVGPRSVGPSQDSIRQTSTGPSYGGFRQGTQSRAPARL